MKNGLKTLLCAILIALVCAASPRVYAWFLVNHTTEVTIADVDEPYWFDLLFLHPDAPELTDAELAERLPASYRDSVFADFMNGFRDTDGYVSFRLYFPIRFGLQNPTDDVFAYSYHLGGTVSYKLAVVFADGTMAVSPVVTQTKFAAQITYDLALVDFEESDYVDPGMIDAGPSDAYWLSTSLFFLLGMIALNLVLLPILLLFGYRRKKTFLAIGLANLSAYGAVASIVYLGKLTAFAIYPYFVILVVAAIAVAQMLYLAIRHPEQHAGKAVLYVAVADVIAIVYSALLFPTLF